MWDRLRAQPRVLQNFYPLPIKPDRLESHWEEDMNIKAYAPNTGAPNTGAPNTGAPVHGQF